jgi:hypothetical protein
MTRRLWVLCMMVATGVGTARVAQGQLITGLTRTNSTNGEPRVVPEGLAVGSPVFVDRTHVYVELPESMVGLEYGMLANNDKTDPDFQLHVTLARSATLYLFLDNRIGDNNGDNPPALGGGVMQWVLDMGFTTTYEQIGIDEDGVGVPGRWFTVYRLQVPAGTTTLYEQNNTGSRSMYAIAVWAPSPTAYDPMPADGAVDVPLDTMLAWRAGADAVSHDVYLGAVFDDVSNADRTNPLGVLVGTSQDANAFDPLGLLDFDGTYFWRVDEVAANGAIIRGTVWQFEVEPQGYAIAGDLIVATASSSQAGFGPEKTIDGSGLDDQGGHSTAARDMWQSEAGAAEPVWIQYEFDKVYKLHQLQVWNYNGDLEYLVGFGLKEVTVQYSLDGADWAVLGDFTFIQGPSLAGYTADTTVDFGGVAARSVRLVVNSSWGSMGRHGLSEVRFLYVPTWARQPSPASGQTQVDTDPVLIWRAGRDAASHEVYLSADEQAVVTGTALVDTVVENRYEAAGLTLGTTYHWKIAEVNAAEAVVSWESEVWPFTTRDSYVVDGFESYNDNEEAGLAIWQTWIDGYGTNDNGSQVGHNPAPYAERGTVREGRQSMPFYYDNRGTYRFSEAVRTFEVAQDWTRGGAVALVLYFHGAASNTAGQMYVKINGVRIAYEGAATDLAKPFWIQWTIDLTQLNTVALTDVKTLTIGVDNGGYGMLLFDDLRLYRSAPEPASEEVWIEAEAADAMVSPMRRYADRADAWGGQYIATFGDNSSGDPPDDGVASYTVKLSGGTYRIIGRVIAPTGNDDSFWVRLQGATTNTANHASGWVQWGLEIGADWHNVPVRSMDDADQTVLFTAEPGLYNLEIAFREDGALLDAWMITKQLQ